MRSGRARAHTSGLQPPRNANVRKDLVKEREILRSGVKVTPALDTIGVLPSGERMLVHPSHGSQGRSDRRKPDCGSSTLTVASCNPLGAPLVVCAWLQDIRKAVADGVEQHRVNHTSPGGSGPGSYPTHRQRAQWETAYSGKKLPMTYLKPTKE